MSASRRKKATDARALFEPGVKVKDSSPYKLEPFLLTLPLVSTLHHHNYPPSQVVRRPCMEISAT